jgi:hypothetical protein
MNNTYDRRLSDKLMVAFDQACDQGFVSVAELLLQALEVCLDGEGTLRRVEKRQELGTVISAYARLKEVQEAATRRRA